jgi:ecotin
MITRLTIALCLLCLGTTGVSAQSDELKPFSPPEPGYERFVIELQPHPNERDLRLALLVGKDIEADCNQHSLNGSITQETIKGWGYSYYKVHEAGGVMSTRMACPPDQPSQVRFVTIRESGGLRRYNSKLPVVIYAPQRFIVRYRVSAAGAETFSATRQ